MGLPVYLATAVGSVFWNTLAADLRTAYSGSVFGMLAREGTITYGIASLKSEDRCG